MPEEINRILTDAISRALFNMADELHNRDEFEHGTDPRRADTDRDGVRDDNEVRPVGTIASFNRQNGMLTITLRNGQSVTGLVTPATRIECENEDEVDDDVLDRPPARAERGDIVGSLAPPLVGASSSLPAIMTKSCRHGPPTGRQLPS
jgi:hypothetical protein